MFMSILRSVVALWLAALPLLIAQPAQADVNACTFTMSEVAFGSVDVLPGAAINSNGVLSVHCGLLGTVVGTTLFACVSFPAPRRIQGPSATLNYDFYGPSPATTSWSSTIPIQFPLTLLLAGGTASASIPAAIAAGQATAPPGSYASTVTASITFGLLGCTTGAVYTTTVSFRVDAVVLSTCNVAAETIAFEVTGTLTAALNAQGRVSAKCTSGTSYAIGLDGGLAIAGDPTQRQLLSGRAGSITYGLYQNAARTLPWGNTPASNTVSNVGTAAVQAFPVYARIPVQNTPAPGTYSDTIVVTLTY